MFAGVGGIRAAKEAWTRTTSVLVSASPIASPQDRAPRRLRLFYGAQAFNTSFTGGVATFNAVTPYVGTTDSGATPFTTLRNPFPAGLRGPEGPRRAWPRAMETT